MIWDKDLGYVPVYLEYLVPQYLVKFENSPTVLKFKYCEEATILKKIFHLHINGKPQIPVLRFAAFACD